MSVPKEVHSPARFVPPMAVSFGSEGDIARAVDHENPLPTRAVHGAAGVAALAGEAAASGAIGPFAPELGRPITVTLSGSWAGTVRLLRSIDHGVTRLPLTYPNGMARGAWTANVNAPICEEFVAGATYYLDFERSSGTLFYRMEQ